MFSHRDERGPERRRRRQNVERDGDVRRPAGADDEIRREDRQARHLACERLEPHRGVLEILPDRAFVPDRAPLNLPARLPRLCAATHREKEVRGLKEECPLPTTTTKFRHLPDSLPPSAFLLLSLTLPLPLSPPLISLSPVPRVRVIVVCERAACPLPSPAPRSGSSPARRRVPRRVPRRALLERAQDAPDRSLPAAAGRGEG